MLARLVPDSAVAVLILMVPLRLQELHARDKLLTALLSTYQHPEASGGETSAPQQPEQPSGSADSGGYVRRPIDCGPALPQVRNAYAPGCAAARLLPLPCCVSSK